MDGESLETDRDGNDGHRRIEWKRDERGYYSEERKVVNGD